MPINFDSIKVGTIWERTQLAELWGYKTFHAIARGVITPAEKNIIVLFVTIEKQKGGAQYTDRLEGNKLYWEGEAKNGTDERIKTSTRNGDSIHLFSRERHHSLFEYMGKIMFVSCQSVFEEPSRFEFRLDAFEHI